MLNHSEKFAIYHASEMENLPRRQYLIKGLFDDGGMSVVFGASNSGKTFVALDIAYHVALGCNWYGNKTKRGSVVYIAAEGGGGIRERLIALKKHYDIPKYIDIYVLPDNVSLCGDGNDTEQFLNTIRTVSNLKLIIVDTLARAMSGGDENSSEGMGDFIKNCDIIRAETHAHVMIVHHSGKNKDKGGRGHSSLNAAIDTEIEVKQDNGGIITATVTKQRDGETGREFNFSLKIYDTSVDDDGDAVTSCALSKTASSQQKNTLIGSVKLTFNVLIDLMLEDGKSSIPRKGMKIQRVVHIDGFRDHFLKAGVSNADKESDRIKTFTRHRAKLKSLGYIAEWDSHVWLTDKQDK